MFKQGHSFRYRDQWVCCTGRPGHVGPTINHKPSSNPLVRSVSDLGFVTHVTHPKHHWLSDFSSSISTTPFQKDRTNVCVVLFAQVYHALFNIYLEQTSPTGVCLYANCQYIDITTQMNREIHACIAVPMTKNDNVNVFLLGHCKRNWMPQDLLHCL